MRNADPNARVNIYQDDLTLNGNADPPASALLPKVLTPRPRTQQGQVNHLDEPKRTLPQLQPRGKNRNEESGRTHHLPPQLQP